jgi:hypothetical protein
MPCTIASKPHYLTTWLVNPYTEIVVETLMRDSGKVQDVVVRYIAGDGLVLIYGFWGELST